MRKIPLTEGSTKSLVKDLNRGKQTSPIGPPPPSVYRTEAQKRETLEHFKKMSQQANSSQDSTIEGNEGDEYERERDAFKGKWNKYL